MFDQVSLDTLFSIPQRNGLTKPKRLRGEGVKMVNMGELFSERRIQDMTMDRVPCSERELESNKLEDGDLLFARQSLTLEGAGQSSIFLGDQEDVVFESHLIRCRLDKSKVEPLYYFYFFESKFGKQRIGSIVEQVAAAGIRGSDLVKLPVFLPPVSEQKAIAQILGTLDDKIELNKKLTQTLEEVAKAIFKSWFVDFDPVRAKAENQPTGLPPEISNLFPDELVDSEIGEIPKGWKIKSADDLFDITIGRTPPRKESHWFTQSEKGVPWVSIRDMGDCGTFISKTSECLTHEAVSKHRMHILPAGSVLLSFKLTVGRVSIAAKEVTTNEAIAHFPPSEVFPFSYFAYFYLKEFRYDTLGSTSSIATAVNSKMIKAIPFLVAPSELTAKFENTVVPLIEKIRLASEEIQLLSHLRDALLPKLICGELRIHDAEKFLEEAGI